MPSYTVQPDDTLSAIANRYGVSVDEILDRNEQITNRSYIQVGWELEIPSSRTEPEMPSAQTNTSDPTSENAVAAPCSECVVDVMHVTGSADDHWCEALPEGAAEEIHSEVDTINKLMKEYRDLSTAVPEPDSNNYEQQILEHRQKKNDWLKKAVDVGILEQSDAHQAPEVPQENERQKLEAQLTEIKTQIDFYKKYRPFRMRASLIVHSDANGENQNWQLLKKEKLHELSLEEATLTKKLAATPARQSSSNANPAIAATASDSGGVSEYKPFTGGVSADKISGSGVSGSSTKRSGKAGQDRIVEVMLFSKGNRLSYVRKDFLRKLRTKHHIVSIRKTEQIASMLKGTTQNLKIGDLLKQVKDQIKEDKRKSKLGDMSVKLAEWTLDGKNSPEWVQFLQSEHTTLWKTHLANGDSPETTTMALDSEGHFMRFAAQASANLNGFDPQTGSVDIGVKAEASMSLLEGKAEINGYLPNKAGWDCNWTYIDANGEQAHQSFGKFRFQGQTVVSCFVGAKVSGEAKVGVSGANMLLSSSPGIKSEASELGGGAKITGNAFAGAEAGGELAGKLGWKPPVTAKNKTPKFSDLLELKASGLVAFGAGAGLDFECKLDAHNNIEVHGSGRLVFGPGASGGFGTTIAANKIIQLCGFIFSALRESDYRFLQNVQKDLFLMLSRGFIIALTQPAVSISDLLESGYDGIQKAWRENRSQQDNAEKLARSIASGRWKAAFVVPDGKSFSISELPPETVGPCCYELTETFLLSREEVQEKALVYLLSHVNSWRNFVEILEHMTPDGEKENAMKSLARIQAMLDFEQQSQFDKWISNLSRNSRSKTIAWIPKASYLKVRTLDDQLVAFQSLYKKDTKIT